MKYKIIINSYEVHLSIYESNSFKDIINFIDNNNKLFTVYMDNKLLFSTKEKIFERIDNKIYIRNKFSNKRQLLKNE